MWIRSQSKLNLINVTDIWIVNDTIRASNGTMENPYYDMGEYKSIERAVEILNEIQEKIIKKDIIYEMPLE